jgi:septum formation protein
MSEPLCKLILASGSPRRRELLQTVGIAFTPVLSRIDESPAGQASGEEYVLILAEAKAKKVSVKFPDSWVLGADTEVVLDGRTMGKPETANDARRMLQQLSGKSHRVLTGFCLCHKNENKSIKRIVATEVFFNKLAEREIEWYIHCEEPYDKAGGYAIQGLASLFVKKIHGSYTNVVGLPVCEVYETLVTEGIIQL